MIEELNLKCPYKVYKDLENNIYFFDTKNGVRYISYFTDADDFFDDFHLRDNIYTFGFERKNNIKYSKVLGDKSVRLTLIAILKAFFINKNNVLTFVADISDLKQKARNRLFDIWKKEYDAEKEFEKYDVEIETDCEIYYSSMIIHKNNIHKSEYIKAFLLTAENLNK